MSTMTETVIRDEIMRSADAAQQFFAQLVQVPSDNPMLINKTAEPVENPVLVSPGIPNGVSYRKVFEKCIDIEEIIHHNTGRSVAEVLSKGYER